MEPATAQGRRLAARLTRLRRERGLTQTDLAKKLGTDQPTVSDYERGKRRLHGELILQLADALGVGCDEILGVSGRKDSPEDLPVRRALLKRLRNLDALSPSERRVLFRMIDTFIEHAQLKNAPSSARRSRSRDARHAARTG